MNLRYKFHVHFALEVVQISLHVYCFFWQPFNKQSNCTTKIGESSSQNDPKYIHLVLNVKYESTQIHGNGGWLVISYLVETKNLWRCFSRCFLRKCSNVYFGEYTSQKKNECSQTKGTISKRKWIIGNQPSIFSGCSLVFRGCKISMWKDTSRLWQMIVMC